MLRVKVFYSGDYQSATQIEEEVNKFCDSVHVLSITIDRRSGQAFVRKSQLKLLGYDIIIVYNTDKLCSENNDAQSEADSHHGDEEAFRLYKLLTAPQLAAKMPGDPESIYVQYIERLVTLFQASSEPMLTKMSLARTLGITSAGVGRRDRQISKVLGRAVTVLSDVRSHLQ